MISAELYTAGYIPSDTEEMIRESVIPQVTEFMEYTRSWKEYFGRISFARAPKNSLKHQLK
jgi:hypothetical protein